MCEGMGGGEVTLAQVASGFQLVQFHRSKGLSYGKIILSSNAYRLVPCRVL